MRVNTMIRWAGLASAIALVAACSDAPTAVPAMSAASGDVAYAKGGNGKQDPQTPTVYSQNITIVPGARTIVYLGNFTLDIPANALCDANAGYGREFWNQACTVETKQQVIVASWSVKNGEANLSFNRDVRFAPTKSVWLYVKAVGQWKNTDAILWMEGTGSKAVWVDEGTYDRDMRTYHANGGTVIYRRLKHFSGYNVGAGENCDPLVDPTCGGGNGAELGFLGF